MKAVDKLKDESENNNDQEECEACIRDRLAGVPKFFWSSLPICAHDAAEYHRLRADAGCCAGYPITLLFISVPVLRRSAALQAEQPLPQQLLPLALLL
jgi:hypothetical protein